MARPIITIDRSMATNRNDSSVRTVVTTEQNLCFPSEDFTSWTKNDVTVTPNAIANPIDGLVTASLITDLTTPTVTHRVAGNSVSIKRYEPICYSVFLKNNTRRYAGIWLDTGTLNMIAILDLQTGTTSFVQSTPVGTALSFSAIIENWGNGWYRLSVILTLSINAAASVAVLPSNNGISISYTGNGSSFYLFGANCVRANWAGPYAKTIGSALNSSGKIRDMVV